MKDDEISLHEAAEYLPSMRPIRPEHDGCVGLARGCPVCTEAEGRAVLDTMLAAGRHGKTIRDT